MSDLEDQTPTHVCSMFESQTWRKSLCKNCFHTLGEHSEQLLAQEAEAVAKEKAALKASVKALPESPVSKPDSVKNKMVPPADLKGVKSTNGAREIKAGKDKLLKDVKEKSGSSKDSNKDGGKLLLPKDQGRENGKTGKPGTQITMPTSIKGKLQTATTNTSTSSTLSLTTSSTKCLPKSPPSPTPPPATASNAITAATSDTASSSDVQKPSISKTKNFASKFESKALAPSTDKPSKPSDVLRPGSSTSAAKGIKPAEESPDLKPSLKPQPEKSSDKPKPLSSRLEPKLSRVLAEDTKLTNSFSKVSKAGPSKINDNKPTNDKDDKNRSINDKEIKSSLTSSRMENQDSKTATVGRSKLSPFGKDMLKSTKEVMKPRSSPDSVDDKTTSSHAKDEGATKSNDLIKTGMSKSSTSGTTLKDKVSPNLKPSFGKASESKGKQIEDVQVSKISTKVKGTDDSQTTQSSNNKMAASSARSARGSEQAEAVVINKSGPLAKGIGKDPDSKPVVNTESTDKTKTNKSSTNSKKECSPIAESPKTDNNKITLSRDTDKGTVAVRGSDKRIDSVASSPTTSSKQVSLASNTPTSPSTKNSTPISTLSTTDSKSSSVSSIAKATDSKTSKNTKVDVSKESKPTPSSLVKLKSLEKVTDKACEKETLLPPIKSSLVSSSPTPKTKDDFKDKTKDEAAKKPSVDVKDTIKLKTELKDKDEKLSALSKQLSQMEGQLRTLENERDQLRGPSLQNQKKDAEKMMSDLRTQLSKMDSQCSRLETDNQSLIDKLHLQEASVKRDQECRGKTVDNMNLEEDLEVAEKELEDVKGVNKDLQRQIMEMKYEMDEMYDHFRQSEHEEFRELQKELDITAKNCRILQFKLRKAERLNEQIEEDRIHYEEKLRMLQDQFDSKDAKNHIRVLEEELRVAKEVSVRLHDELDIVEDKRNKALEDNRHLTDLLEHTDRRQFRLQVEIDKLRDIVADLKEQLKEAKSANNNNDNNNKESTPDRKVHCSIYTRSID